MLNTLAPADDPLSGLVRLLPVRQSVEPGDILGRKAVDFGESCRQRGTGAAVRIFLWDSSISIQNYEVCQAPEPRRGTDKTLE